MKYQGLLYIDKRRECSIAQNVSHHYQYKRCPCGQITNYDKYAYFFIGILISTSVLYSR